jgi:hypothetical protein
MTWLTLYKYFQFRYFLNYKLTVRKSVLFLYLRIFMLLVARNKYHCGNTLIFSAYLHCVFRVYMSVWAKKLRRTCMYMSNDNTKERQRRRRKERARENINIQMTSPIVANLRQPILPSLLSSEERHPVEIGNLHI